MSPRPSDGSRASGSWPCCASSRRERRSCATSTARSRRSSTRPEEAARARAHPAGAGGARDRYGLVACISGRRAADARRMVGLDCAHLHRQPRARASGARGRGAGGRPGARSRSPSACGAFADAHFDDRAASRRACGSRTRTRSGPSTSAARPTRTAPARCSSRSPRRPGRPACVPHWGRKVLEIRPTATVDKGTAVAAALAGARARVPRCTAATTRPTSTPSGGCAQLQARGRSSARSASGWRRRKGPRRSPTRRTSSSTVPTASASCSPSWRPETRSACSTPTSSSRP